ncbi:hypothetical protein PILCRDRAFT_264576 [Piloderma croceum F 1598]|uniref:Uncharacterized protein n=1 Tax=Piloderma croceum (strain F 1598) TaxID=765440 RepID=A0A0C3BN42_PILCF|nr:hypothetical protein PILCRDRAFT_264576 [Piloderma croceum F 1598]
MKVVMITDKTADIIARVLVTYALLRPTQKTISACAIETWSFGQYIHEDKPSTCIRLPGEALPASLQSRAGCYGIAVVGPRRHIVSERTVSA